MRGFSGIIISPSSCIYIVENHCVGHTFKMQKILSRRVYALLDLEFKTMSPIHKMKYLISTFFMQVLKFHF